MRQVTIVKTLAKFSELSEDQKNKVIEKLWDINTNYNWFDYHIEEFETKLKKLGFYKIQTEFSGFSSQGDGAKFTAMHQRGEITSLGRYSNSSYMRSDNEVLLAVAKRLADKLYRQLNAEYDYLTSRKAIVETIEANEYEFDVDTLKIGV